MTLSPLSLWPLVVVLFLFFTPSSSSSSPSLPPSIPTLTLSQFVNLTIPPPLSAEQIEVDILSLYPLPSVVTSVRSHLPRFYGPDYFPPPNQSAALHEWIEGTLLYLVPGVVCAGLVLIAWVTVSVASCCFVADKQKSSSGEGSKRLSSVVLFTALLITVVFSAVGIAYDAKLSSALTGGSSQGTLVATNSTLVFPADQENTVGVTSAVNRGLSDMDTFFSVFPLLLNNLIVLIDETVPQVNTGLVDATSVIAEFNDLLLQLQNSANTIDSFNVDGIQCNGTSTCLELVEPLQSLIVQLNTLVLPVLYVIDNDVNTVRSTLLSSQQLIDADLEDAISQIDHVYEQTESYQSDGRTATSDVDYYNRIRFALTLVVFLAPILVTISIVIGFIFRSSLLLKINFHLMFLIMIIMWLVFAAHLSLTSAVSDTCVYGNTFQNSLPDQFDPQTTAVVQACLLNTSLITAVNATQSLSFAFSITIPNISSTDQIFNVSQLSSLTMQVDELTIDKLGFNTAVAAATQDAALSELNHLTAPDQFTLANVQNCQPQQYPPSNRSDTIASLQSSILDSLSVEKQLNNTILQFQTNVSSAFAQAQSIQAQANSIFTQFLDLGDLIAPVVVASQDIITSAYCGPIGNDYGEAKHSYCSDVQQSCGLIDLCAFVIALVLIPATVSLIAKAYQYEETEPSLTSPSSYITSSPYEKQESPVYIHQPSALYATGSRYQ